MKTKEEEKEKKPHAHGGNTLASIPGWHTLLALRSHGSITKEQFDRRTKKLKREFEKNKTN